jgi:hypothetical protein
MYINIYSSPYFLHTGTYDKPEKSKRYGVLKDKYLISEGVIIERINSAVLGEMNDEEITVWLKSIVNSAL